MLNTTQFAAANQANFDALMGLTTKAFEGLEKIAALNLQVAKTSLNEAVESGRAAQSAKDPQAVLALQAEMLQPAAEKAAAYGRQVYDIVTKTQADVEKAAAVQIAGIQSLFAAAVDAAAKNAPEGSASGVAMFKQAMAAANNAIDGMQKAARQATDAAEANYAAVANTVVKSAGKAKRG